RSCAAVSRSGAGEFGHRTLLRPTPLATAIVAGCARLASDPARGGEWQTAHLSPCSIRVFLSATIMVEVANSPTGRLATPFHAQQGNGAAGGCEATGEGRLPCR